MFEFLKKSRERRNPAPDKKSASAADPESMILKMQQTMGNKATLKFLETLKRRSPGSVNDFVDLSLTGEGFKGMRDKPEGADDTHRIEASKHGANDAYTLTEKQGKRKAKTERKFYHKVKTVHVGKVGQDGEIDTRSDEIDYEAEKLNTKKKIYKEVYMPMIAAGLGIDQLPLSTRVDTAKQAQKDNFGYMKQSKGTMNEIIKGRDLMRVNEEDHGKFNEIDPEQLQKLMIFDLLFENKDAHYRQYILGDDNQLSKVDNEDYLRGEDATLKAGSFLAGLPLANRQMTEGSISMIRNWDAKYVKEMMQDAAFHAGSGEQRERHGVFDKDQINKVMSNMKDLKLLAEESERSGLSAREVFDLYNARDESDKMTGEFLDREKTGLPGWRPAKFNNQMGTGLPLYNDTQFENLDQDEAREADQLAAMRGGHPVDLTGFQQRLKHHDKLQGLSSRYREMRSLRRQVTTPRIEEERYHRHKESTLTSLSANLDNNLVNQLLTHDENDS